MEIVLHRTDGEKKKIEQRRKQDEATHKIKKGKQQATMVQLPKKKMYGTEGTVGKKNSLKGGSQIPNP